MRKLAIYLMTALLIAASALAASVSRSMPARADPGSVLTVTFYINDATANEAFAIEDKLPAGWTITDWSVTGAKEAKEQITIRFEPPKYGWSFTPSGSSATLSYTLTLPSTEGSYTFDAVWFDRNGQSRSTQALAVRAVRCGDGVCESVENSDNCAADCPVTTTVVSQEFATTTIEIEQTPPRNYTWLWIILGVVAVLLILSLILRKKHQSTKMPKI
jgi:hypothetical protein